MSEGVEGLDLEQRCIQPGHWRIEGYDVIQVGRTAWGVFRPIRGGERSDNWAGKRVALKKTLRGCREWIADGAEVSP